MMVDGAGNNMLLRWRKSWVLYRKYMRRAVHLTDKVRKLDG
ncbi:MAG: hypothetical protein AAGC71_17275 [Pseudomonadota bacterium]